MKAVLITAAIAALAAPALAQKAKPPAADAPPPKAQTPADVDAWRAAYIADQGYAYGFRTPDSVIYLRIPEDQDLRRSPVRVWVRAEYFEAGKGEDALRRSERYLVAYDCPLGRYRYQAGDTYPQLNLQGEPESHDSQDDAFEYPRPETLDEHLTFFACGVVKRMAGYQQARR